MHLALVYLKTIDGVYNLDINFCCSTIYRMNSWSRMQITGDMFRMLCAASRATPRMVDLVRGMQYKSAPGDEHFMGCYYDINGHENCSVGARYESSPEPTPDLGFGESCLHWAAGKMF